MMNTKIQVFNHEQFGQIRICQADGKVWFNLSDVCKALELANVSRVKSRLEKRGVTTMNTPTFNQHGAEVLQAMNYVDEANLYRCIFQSRKAEAQKFQDWVFEEVLPSIRKDGGYLHASADMTEEEIMARAVLLGQRRIEVLRQQLELQAPKVAFADAVTASSNSILMRDLAKLITQNGYPIGQNRLYDWMRQNGYLFLHENRPMQRFVEMGIFETSVTIVNTHHGPKERLTTKVTGKGQEYFINKFKSAI